MKIKSILRESIYTAVDIKAGMKFIRNNCSTAFDAFEYNNENVIVRGAKNTGDGIVIAKPQNGTRKSTSNSNYYTILMSQLPSFADFPSRSSSLICSTDPDVAAYYGKMYYVFPSDSTDAIAIANTSDIWHNTVRILGMNLSLLSLNEKIEEYFGTYVALPTYQSQLAMEKSEKLGCFYKDVVEKLTPASMGIDLVNLGAFYSSGICYNKKTELWFSGTAALVDVSIFY